MRKQNHWFLAIVLIAGGAALFAWFFTQLPIDDTGLAIDWKHIWQAALAQVPDRRFQTF